MINKRIRKREEEQGRQGKGKERERKKERKHDFSHVSTHLKLIKTLGLYSIWRLR